MLEKSYQQRREEIYLPLRTDGVFTWDWLYDEEYALANIITITRNEQRELQQASSDLAAIFAKTVQAVQQMPDDVLAELGLMGNLAACARRASKYMHVTLFGRFDFAKTSAGYKLLEYNADTPSGIVETLYVNEYVCRHFKRENPNAGLLEGLQRGFSNIVVASSKQNKADYKNIVFSSLGWHEEDRGTAQYLCAQSGLSARYVPLADLRWVNDRLCCEVDNEYRPIDLWMRLHPFEVMADDCDEDGFPIGQAVLAAIARGDLTVINPPSALVAQSKALQALIWGLYEQQQFFSSEEQQIIARYMLPTYLDNRFIGKADYVVKPIFGREGANVELYDSEGRLLACKDGKYGEQAVVYQQAVGMESYSCETSNGMFNGQLLWGVFAIDGQGSAIMARLGGAITHDMAYFLPVGLEE